MLTITDQITALLAADPACNGRVTGETVRAIAGLVSERDAIVDWLRQDAHEASITACCALADAIERGDFRAGEG